VPCRLLLLLLLLCLFVPHHQAGQVVTARVIGFRLLDGLATVSLKPSVIEQAIHSVKDLYPGQLLPAVTVAKVLDQGGLVLQLNATLKALVPALHMSDLGTKKGGTKGKFKEGQKVTGRVLSVDPVEKKVQVTLKKSLLGSKLPVLSDLRQASPGMKVHGVVTGITSWGAYVTFYGGLAGLLQKDTLDLLPGQSLEDVVSLGQVLRVTVGAVDLAKRRLLLRLAGKKAAAQEAAAAAAPWGGWAVGEVIPTAKVVEITAAPDYHHHQQQHEGDDEPERQQMVVLEVAGKEGSPPIRAVLAAPHLSDHPAGAAALLEALTPGAALGPLLVLNRRRQRAAAGAGAGEEEQYEEVLVVSGVWGEGAAESGTPGDNGVATCWVVCGNVL
jgi:rRNA biogenesis protein RRP5